MNKEDNNSVKYKHIKTVNVGKNNVLSTNKPIEQLTLLKEAYDNDLRNRGTN